MKANKAPLQKKQMVLLISGGPNFDKLNLETNPRRDSRADFDFLKHLITLGPLINMSDTLEICKAINVLQINQLGYKGKPDLT